MEITNIIGVAVLIIAIGVIIVLRIIKWRKSTDAEKLSISTFVNTYGDQIAEALKDVVEIMQINKSDYEDSESYEKAVISMTVAKIKENLVEMDVNNPLMTFVDPVFLTPIIQDMLHNDKLNLLLKKNDDDSTKDD